MSESFQTTTGTLTSRGGGGEEHWGGMKRHGQRAAENSKGVAHLISSDIMDGKKADVSYMWL